MKNHTLIRYTQAQAGTHPAPSVFHQWVLLSAVAASLGRRCWFVRGNHITYPNMYVMLVGDPGSAKTSAMGFFKELTEGMNIKYSGTDTGGYKQSLISVMTNERLPDADSDDLFGDYKKREPQTADASIMCFVPEASTFFGMNSYDLQMFLTSMYDCLPYEYSLKKSRQIIAKPCVNILAATTPVTMPLMFPNGGADNGALSRFVMVHGESQSSGFWFDTPNNSDIYEVKQAVRGTELMEGAFTHTHSFRPHFNELCERPCGTDDIRFLYYTRRRPSHLIKMSMALAALRGSMECSIEDLDDAHELLYHTEQQMPEALGDYGMKPDQQAMVRVRKLLKETMEPMTFVQIMSKAGAGARMQDLMAALVSLTQNKVITTHRITDAAGNEGVAWQYVMATRSLISYENVTKIAPNKTYPGLLLEADKKAEAEIMSKGLFEAIRARAQSSS